MHCFSWCRRTWFVIQAIWLASWLLLPQLAWAQDEEAAPTTNAKWLLPYCLVGLLVGLSVYSMGVQLSSTSAGASPVS